MKSIIILTIAISLSSCEPVYNCYFKNVSGSDIYIKTHPSIESFYLTESTYYDTIISYRVNQVDKYSMYKIPPYKTFLLYGELGVRPYLQEIPFDYIEIIQGSDTVVLDSKEKILERLEQEGKTRKYYIKE